MSESLVDVSKEPAVLIIGDKQYKLRKLTLKDYAAAMQFIRDERVNHALNKVVGNPLIQESVRAQIISDLECTPIGLPDVLGNVTGETFLLHRSLMDNGPHATYEWVMGLPDMTRRVMDDILFYVCGLSRPSRQEAAAPIPLGNPASETTP